MFLQSFFKKVLSFSVGEGIECVCVCAECRKKNFLLRARTILHVFPVFFSQGDNPKISPLQKVEEMASFACKKTV